MIEAIHRKLIRTDAGLDWHRSFISTTRGDIGSVDLYAPARDKGIRLREINTQLYVLGYLKISSPNSVKVQDVIDSIPKSILGEVKAIEHAVYMSSSYTFKFFPEDDGQNVFIITLLTDKDTGKSLPKPGSRAETPIGVSEEAWKKVLNEF